MTQVKWRTWEWAVRLKETKSFHVKDVEVRPIKLTAGSERLVHLVPTPGFQCVIDPLRGALCIQRVMVGNMKIRSDRVAFVKMLVFKHRRAA